MKFKKGDFVEHIDTGHIGTIAEVVETWNLGTGEPMQDLVRVKWDTASKRDGKGLYDPEALAPLRPRATDTNVTDWLSTPKEKLRNALGRKYEKVRMNNLRTGKIRMDGRR